MFLFASKPTASMAVATLMAGIWMEDGLRAKGVAVTFDFAAGADDLAAGVVVGVAVKRGVIKVVGEGLAIATNCGVVWTD